MPEEVKPLFQSIPPYSPRRRRSMSGGQNTSLPQLFYNDNGYRRNLSSASLDSEEDTRSQHQCELAPFYQLIPVYDKNGEYGSTMALVPVTRDTVRRSLDGSASDVPRESARLRPVSMPGVLPGAVNTPQYHINNGWTRRNSLDSERPLLGPSYDHFHHKHAYPVQQYSNPTQNQTKQSTLSKLKSHVRRLFGKKSKKPEPISAYSQETDSPNTEFIGAQRYGAPHQSLHRHYRHSGQYDVFPEE